MPERKTVSNNEGNPETPCTNEKRLGETKPMGERDRPIRDHRPERRVTFSEKSQCRDVTSSGRTTSPLLYSQGESGRGGNDDDQGGRGLRPRKIFSLQQGANREPCEHI